MISLFNPAWKKPSGRKRDFESNLWLSMKDRVSDSKKASQNFYWAHSHMHKGKHASEICLDYSQGLKFLCPWFDTTIKVEGTCKCSYIYLFLSVFFLPTDIRSGPKMAIANVMPLALNEPEVNRTDSEGHCSFS